MVFMGHSVAFFVLFLNCLYTRDMSLQTIDVRLIHFFKKASIPVARFGLFVVFFWFGFLKVIGLSPASGLVQRLFEDTIPFMSFHSFLVRGKLYLGKTDTEKIS